MTGDPRFPKGKPPCWIPPAADVDGRSCTSTVFDRSADCADCRYSAPRELDRAAIASLLGEEAAEQLFPEET